ncbi:unnamed protein product, partial [Closterium sp. NIES-54]
TPPHVTAASSMTRLCYFITSSATSTSAHFQTLRPNNSFMGCLPHFHNPPLFLDHLALTVHRASFENSPILPLSPPLPHLLIAYTWTLGVQLLFVPLADTSTSLSSLMTIPAMCPFTFSPPSLKPQPLSWNGQGRLIHTCIRQTFTLPDSPQQNGVAESRNRILVQIARCLLTHASAPPSLWEYAILHAAALHNLHPHPHHTHTTPAELWTGQKPSVRPLRVWGCTSYVLLNSQARRAKLAPKTITCVYLGHNSNSPDYLFLHPTTNKLYRSRDVFFDESHPFYPSSTVSPSPPPPSLTWADFDNLPPATTPSPPLPAPSTVSDPPSPASPSSTT